MKKMLNAMFVAVLLTGGVAACGSDDDENDDSPSTEVTTAEGSDGTAGQSSENADVVEYCEQADEFAAAMADVKSDPTSGDLTELMEESQTLIARAAELTSANPDDADAIAECNQKIADAAQS